MGKGQYENTKGMSIKNVYYTKFIPMLMDKIGDADEYQRIYDKVLKKGRYIERSYKGENLSSIIPEWLGHPSNKIANIEILFKDWYNGDGFEEDFNIMMGIYKDDEKAIAIKDEYLKTHPYVKSCIEEEEEAKQQETTEQPKEVESVAAYTPNTTITGNKPDTVLLQSLEELRNHLISYPETSLPKSPYTIPTVLPPKLLLVNKSTASLVKRTSYEFMLDFNNDYLKDCFDKNAPTNINNITERFKEWEAKYGIPVIFSKLYTIFWNLLLIAMDDDLYNQYLSKAINLAHLLSIDENLLQDLCHGVGYVLAGKKLNQDCDLQCKTAECRTFFLHK